MVNAVEESALVVSGPEVNPAISGLLASVAARDAGDGVLPTNSCGESIMVYLGWDCVLAVRYAAAEDDWCSVLHSCVFGGRLRRGCVLLEGGMSLHCCGLQCAANRPMIRLCTGIMVAVL